MQDGGRKAGAPHRSPGHVIPNIREERTISYPRRSLSGSDRLLVTAEEFRYLSPLTPQSGDHLFCVDG
jgi:hypothetical protein